MAALLALVNAVIPFFTAPTSSMLSATTISRVDQYSRTISVRNPAPGTTITLFINGKEFSQVRVATSPVVQFNLIGQLTPGTVVSATFSKTRAPSLSSTLSTTVANDYTTYHYDNARDGWNPYETTLSPSNVNSANFGLLFSLAVDGNAYAQPLYMQGLTIGGRVHNVLLAATENDSVYAFDADTGLLLWHTQLTNSALGTYPVSSSDVSNCPGISPSIGITGTPVIDPSSNTLYVVATLKQRSGTITTFHQLLHALNILTGLDQPGSPIEIAATARLSDGTLVQFNPRWQNQRAGLALNGGVLYVGYASHCDYSATIARGWLLAYNASTLQQLAVFNTVGDPSTDDLSSIWGSGFAPAIGPSGSVYFATGNGIFNVFSGGLDYGDSVLRLTASLQVTDYFTPYDQSALNSQDNDLGSGGFMLLPTQKGSYPYIAVMAGKEGVVYLLNRAHLGKYTPGGPDAVLQELSIGRLWGGPAYFGANGNQLIYYAGNQDNLRAFLLSGNPPRMTVSSTSSGTYPDGGAIPSVSSNGSKLNTGIVWTTTRSGSATTPIYLIAYNAANVSQELFSAAAGPWPNIHGRPFMTPTIVNGKVYIGTANSVAVFGLK